ncbi:MAG: putative 2-aminoethylphosphonate ABC transporter permease subunit [Armatimonadota bacterium]|nr:putative 2-aminoethylphosphonate ABC transporter permease subunit [Armatimonadota bacterium]MDR7523662.1 putative 2-aminoethylphosphonate ABC transporter permease subunit [Armatimonadota bacterium]
MATAVGGGRVRQKLAGDEWLARGGLAGLALWLAVTVALPLWALLSRSVLSRQGQFVGLANYADYFSNPALFSSFWNSLTIALATTVLVLPTAFVYAYALTRTCMEAKGLFGAVALIPILAPSLLQALALVYLFGNQGLVRDWLFGRSIYGPIGIIIAETVYCFPHALMILVTALRMSDARLYESAAALGASPWRVFFTVTLPGVKYGVISAGFVVFTLTITDFGIPKVIGGQFNVLATDVYKQVFGRQNFEMGAVVSVALLVPAVLSFLAERYIRQRQMAQLTAQAVPFSPTPKPLTDRSLFVICTLIAIPIVGLLVTAAWGSFIRFWPYNLAMSLRNYEFSRFETEGWLPYFNSLRMAGLTALFGTAIVFTGAYFQEKTRAGPAIRSVVQLFAMLPVAVPGLVLGISYILFFNHPANPLGFLYGTLAIMVINTIAHFYTVSHLTATTALKQLGGEFEAVAASLQVPFYRTFWKVTVPVSLPAILDIAVYMFVNAMTTVSAVIFLWVPQTRLASIAAVYMDDTGQQGAAAAMAMMIVYTSAAVKLLHVLLSRYLDRRTQAWRRR